MRHFLIIVFASLIFIGSVFAVNFPIHKNFVSDFTATLSPQTVDKLNTNLKNYEVKTGTEIAVAIINSTDEIPIWKFATDLANEWGIGKKDVDNGALLLVAKNDHQLFIATGSQLEGGLTDVEAKNIINTVIAPQFKKEDFDTGIINGTNAMIASLQGESFTDLRALKKTNSEINFSGIIFFVVFFIFPWLAAILGRSKKFWPGGVGGAVTGGISGVFFGLTFGGIAIVAIGVGLLGLLFDFIVSRNFITAQKSGTPIAWWAGGNRGKFGGSGGFGGGGFGGGGAGGNW